VVGVVLNGVIGAGIFGLASKVFALSGPYSLLAFGLCAVCVSLIAKATDPRWASGSDGWSG
jgi:L-asparagine transporter-like permease